MLMLLTSLWLRGIMSIIEWTSSMDKTSHQTNAQRGSMVLEIALVAAIIALLGFVGWRYYAAKQAATKPSSVATQNKTDLPKADGKVETAVTAVSADADIDRASSDSMEGDTGEVNATSDDAAQVQGSINKDAF